MRVLLTGVGGQIGSQLKKDLGGLLEVIGTTSRTMNLLDAEAIRGTINKIRPDLIINAAAYTKVDQAEADHEVAMKINGMAPGVLAECAKMRGIPLIHISTDYVFDGNQESPYKEDDPVNPLSVYGKSKLLGEREIVKVDGEHLIFRTSWIYGEQGHNFYNTIRKLLAEKDEIRVVSDQIGAPTSSLYFSRVIKKIIVMVFIKRQFPIKEVKGIYHITCGGRGSWYDFASEILKSVKEKQPCDCGLLPLQTRDYQTAAQRPLFSVLDNQKASQVFSIKQTDWRDSFDEIVRGGESG